MGHGKVLAQQVSLGLAPRESGSWALGQGNGYHQSQLTTQAQGRQAADGGTCGYSGGLRLC